MSIDYSAFKFSKSNKQQTTPLKDKKQPQANLVRKKGKEKEFCIMPKDSRWKTERFTNSQRHEIFGGINRQQSIKYGLVIFLTLEQHTGTNKAIHKDKKFMEYAHKIGQKTWQKYYNKTKEDFIKVYGQNYL